MIPLNSPLRVGQVLKPRFSSQMRVAKIKDYFLKNNSIIWVLEFESGNILELTLSEIYAEFQFTY